ncbi:MAG TPA: metallophosphoesterase, partial [Porphyromonadaceae bacterium]|nr:metallophosphoesterase [Porphyromonadaceae bacterium]
AMCRANLRAKEAFGGYTILTVTPDSIQLQERLVSGVTKAPWLSYAIASRPQWVSDAPRPDYSINAANPQVSEVWSVQEASDMGSGMFLSGDKLVYTNTAGEIKAANAANGKTIWTYKTDGKIYSTPTVQNQTVWCASSDSYLYGIDLRNGKQRFRLKNNKAVVASPA